MSRRAVLWFAWVVFLVASCVNGTPSGDGSCPAGLTSCSGRCVNQQSDNQNCGACAMACPAGNSCTAGVCSACAVGATPCNGTCTNIQTDISNCGACGVPCGSNQACVSGLCGCPGSLKTCGAACIDATSNVSNCGDCNKACQAGQLCQASACTCLAGRTACGAAGSCVDLKSDPANCGTCGTACGAGLVCSLGVCSATCDASLLKCGSACVNATSDALNCGACGTACQAGQACTGGMCACPVAGQTLCGNDCVDTTSSATNCGSCGIACSGGQLCSAGTCSCQTAGQQFCGNQCIDTSSNSQHCGTCDNVCGAGQSCVQGQCSCPSGQAICNGACAPAGQCGTGGAGGGGAGGGGGGTGGSGATGRPPGCPAADTLLSDFEEGSAVIEPKGGRNGWWYTYADSTTGIFPTPTASAIAATMLPSADQVAPCNRWALNSYASGHSMYVGTGAALSPVVPPPPSGQKSKNAVDLSAYSGISFRIKSGSGAAPPVFFELLNTETQPAPDGIAVNPAVDAFNTRGRLLSNISTSWQTVSVPFGLLAPRYLPSTACVAGVFCEAPAFNSKTALGFQFSVYPQFTTSGGYNIWVDDVSLYTGDAGIATYTQSAGAFPFPQDKAVGSCAKPTVPGASGKFLIDAYVRWKKTFVTATGAPSGALRVQRPENANDTVSEGIAYGMLIAVYMNDKPLFDGLWAYWSAPQFKAAGHLMHWQINSGGGVIGSGSATDADEDAAFALLMAGKQWTGTTYTATGTGMVADIWANDIETAAPNVTLNVKAGNQFSNSSQMNPSYFAPAYYRVFKGVDSAHDWLGVATAAYANLNKIAGTRGLVPGWCTNGCTTPGGGPSTDAEKYQYDAHRTPWRIGLDACWNGTADAKAYVLKTSNFFANLSGTAGIGTIADIYMTDGTPKASTPANSMSCVGTASVGAMATAGSNAGHMKFLNSSYHFLLDAVYTPDPQAQATAYTYFNATVGLLTALTVTGNFNSF